MEDMDMEAMQELVAAGDGVGWRFRAPEMEEFLVVIQIGSHESGLVFGCVDMSYSLFSVKSYNLAEDTEQIHDHFEERRPLLMKNHPNIVSMSKGIYSEQNDMLYEIFPFDGCIVIRNIISNGDFDVTVLDVKAGLRDALKAVSHYHHVGYPHGAITPASLVYHTASKKIKLTSFLHIDPNYPWYWAPEHLLSPSNAATTFEADIWALGCSFAEVTHGSPVFGGDELSEIFRTIIGEDEARWPTNVEELPKLESEDEGRITWALSVFVPPKFGMSGLSLLSDMLRLHPADRISAKSALSHPFFRGI